VGELRLRKLAKHVIQGEFRDSEGAKPAADSEADIVEMAREYCHGTPLVPETILAEWRQRYAGSDGASPTLYTAPGCSHCNHTGHKGRVGIYELMTATAATKKLIQARAPVEQLFQSAVKDGMLTLKQYGMIRVLEGLTDLVSVRSACA
jgi:type II secretory ATPase GspE/PulE/Tfp pilus assembly ATPase PilB-like protein